MAISLDDARGEATAEEVAGAAVTPVEELRVDAVEVLDALGQILLRRLDDEVDVIRHETESVQAPAVTANRLDEKPEVQAGVLGVEEDAAAVHPAREDVEIAVGLLGAPDARHRERR
jgi:hypothetical protein